jgi:uncharacterized protein YlxW (UPF0749 family)
MAESVVMTSAILDKKMEQYRWHSNDYVAENELTITITLAEYRELVQSAATKQYDIAKANEDKYKRDNENMMLKQELDSLRAKLYELQNACNFEREVMNHDGCCGFGRIAH